MAFPSSTVPLPPLPSQVMKKKHTEIGLVDKLKVPQFQEVWRSLGFPLPAKVVNALFNKYGQDVHGQLPVTVSWAEFWYNCINVFGILCTVNCRLSASARDPEVAHYLQCCNTHDCLRVCKCVKV